MRRRFGELLQKKRVAKKISLRDLGKAVELSPVYLSDIERSARRPPAVPIIERIAAALQEPPDELIQAALVERRTVELDIRGQGVRRDAALLLARVWDELDDETLERLKQVLAGEEERV